jgi:hypothetical protein
MVDFPASQRSKRISIPVQTARHLSAATCTQGKHSHAVRVLYEVKFTRNERGTSTLFSPVCSDSLTFRPNREPDLDLATPDIPTETVQVSNGPFAQPIEPTARDVADTPQPADRHPIEDLLDRFGSTLTRPSGFSRSPISQARKLCGTIRA